MQSNISLLDNIELTLISECNDEMLKNLKSRKPKTPKEIKSELLKSWRTVFNCIIDSVDDTSSNDRDECYLITNFKMPLEQLIEKVSKIEIARSKINTSGIVFGKVSITKIIAQHWGPVFNKVIPEKLHADWFHQYYKTPISPSFSDYVQNFNSLSGYADFMLYVRDNIEISEDDNYSELVYQGELLNITASIIEAVVKTFDQYYWCAICYRRTVDNRKYCHEHKRNENISPGLNINGTRTRIKLTRQTLTLFHLYQFRRNFLKETVHVLSNSEHVPFEIPVNWRSISFPIPIGVLRDIEDTRYWENAKSQWDELYNSMPFLRKKLKSIPSTYKTWESFSTSLLKSIKDNYEKTKNPLWILHIAVLSERWFEAESKIKDRRKTNTKTHIKELLDEGLVQSKIAERLGISKAAVSKAVKIMKQV